MRWLENMERRGKDHITKSYTVESKGNAKEHWGEYCDKESKKIATKREHGLGERIFLHFGQSISQFPVCDKRARMM